MRLRAKVKLYDTDKGKIYLEVDAMPINNFFVIFKYKTKEQQKLFALLHVPSGLIITQNTNLDLVLKKALILSSCRFLPWQETDIELDWGFIPVQNKAVIENIINADSKKELKRLERIMNRLYLEQKMFSSHPAFSKTLDLSKLLDTISCGPFDRKTGTGG